ncbi:MAG: aminotransferase class I/II-fold pyridoxal phosphate-dependent enzyme [Defluviitaleaceae bacterium]|nr:aminotransferase class I/II-fold pyridoxal phosphate-dependent enzyme [Defluviitaleaceae bacterium]
MTPDKYLTKKAKSLHPYVAGLQPQEPGWIKLNTNENPYPPSPKVNEILRSVDTMSLRLYPPGDGGLLRQTITASLIPNPTTEHQNSQQPGAPSVFCGNGSDEVLALAFQAFFSGKSNIHTPDISYGFYPVWGAMYDVGLNYIPVEEDFSINPAKYSGGNGVIIANPNAPTSLAAGLGAIEDILKQNPNGVVLVDEAYIDFANMPSAVALLPKYENLLVVRTFSKSHALAGMRVGYAIGHPRLIDALHLMKESFNSYPLDILAQKAAAAAFSDTAYLASTVEKVIATRDRTIAALAHLGYKTLPSQANFILINIGERAEELYEHLLANKILARYWNKPRIAGFLRVTIGTDEEMEVFISCVKQW